MKSRFVYALPALLLSLIAVGLGVYGLSIGQQESAAMVGSTPENPPLNAQVVEQESAPSFRYAIAKETLQAGEILESAAFLEVESKEELAELVRFDDVPFGEPLNVRLDRGLPLSKESLHMSNPVQNLLQLGHIAVAVDLTNLSSVGGLIRPGDSVDIFASFRDEGDETAVSAKLFSAVPVLAVRGATSVTDEVNEDAQRRNATMVLAIPESEVSKLTLALAESKLTFAATKPRSTSVETLATGLTATSTTQAESSEQVTFISDIRPEREPKQTLRSLSPPQEKKEEPGREVRVFEGSESRSVYVR